MCMARNVDEILQTCVRGALPRHCYGGVAGIKAHTNGRVRRHGKLADLEERERMRAHSRCTAFVCGVIEHMKDVVEAGLECRGGRERL